FFQAEDGIRDGHVTGVQTCALPISEDDAALVEWLVLNHLTMSSTAQKQDISDPDLVAAFAHKVATERRLVALYLFTVADIRGTKIGRASCRERMVRTGDYGSYLQID